MLRILKHDVLCDLFNVHAWSKLRSLTLSIGNFHFLSWCFFFAAHVRLLLRWCREMIDYSFLNWDFFALADTKRDPRAEWTFTLRNWIEQFLFLLFKLPFFFFLIFLAIACNVLWAGIAFHQFLNRIGIENLIEIKLKEIVAFQNGCEKLLHSSFPIRVRLIKMPFNCCGINQIKRLKNCSIYGSNWYFFYFFSQLYAGSAFNDNGKKKQVLSENRDFSGFFFV